MKIIRITDNNYPDNLRNIVTPPKQLYVLGNETILNEFGLAIIGCRQYSDYGKKIAKDLSFKLAKQGINIISGMARGIDSFAHISCLSAGGKTIAVLGSGFNHIYPKENIEIFKEIIKGGGAVITEYPPDTKPLANNFPNRNRIISGLAEGIIVVEARRRSGTLITVEHALEQGKDIFAVPRKY